jgi:hypothetical protein
MSGGMEESRAFEGQEKALREAAHALGVALQEARDGHRGWSISTADILETVNDYMQDECPHFELRVKVPRER